MPRARAPGVSLEDVTAYLMKRGKVRLEKRHSRFMFGASNYGDVPGMINEADGDPWDVFTPGIARRLDTSKTYRVKRVLGVVILANGNHKIAVELFVPGFDERRLTTDINTYMTNYSAFTRVAATWRAHQTVRRSEATSSAIASSSVITGETAGSSLEEC